MPRKKPKENNGSLAAGGAIRENVKIEVNAALERFANSETETELDFPSAFDNKERAYIHKLCKKYGLQSKSYGKGELRQLKVTRRSGTAVDLSRKVYVSGVVLETLNQVLVNYPNPDGVARHCIALPPNNGSGKRSKESTSYHLSWLGRGVPPSPRRPADLSSFRQQLPVWNKQDELLQLLDSNQVILLSGGTGCGKTTQVPQFILDEASLNGRPINIICTQPRRLSAIGVAERVAAERGEDAGSTVGYVIRLDSKVSERTRLTFCTNGVLLRTLMMADKKHFDNITHIIVDEIHERDRFSDFLLISLRNVLKEWPHLRLVLMSATMETEVFLDYFNRCPHMVVEGRTYPVQAIFLGDVLYHTGYKNNTMKSALSSKRRATASKDEDRLSRAVTELAALGTKKATDTAKELTASHLPATAGAADVVGVDSGPGGHIHPENGRDEEDEDEGVYDDEDDVIIIDSDNDGDGDSTNDQASKGTDGDGCNVDTLPAVADNGQLDDEVPSAAAMSEELSEELSERQRLLMAYQESFNDDLVDSDLIITLVEKLIIEGADGAILVFLPGYEEIVGIGNRLLDGPLSRKISLIMLHSQMQPSDQRKVFDTVPRGLRKVVLSTNLAETSITINDVVFVIDSGKVKEKAYDSAAAVSTLQSKWVSRASALQRRGRAGRCQHGYCYHLMSQHRYQRLAEHPEPEILRIPLQELCLQTKLLTSPNMSIAEFLGSAPAAPSPLALHRAVANLIGIGALDKEERLTALGHHLLSLSVEPQLGKMLIYGVLFRCLDPIVTIACLLAYRQPWILPSQGRKALGRSARLRLAGDSLSDHLTMYTAFEEWLSCNGHQRYRYCQDNFMSHPVMLTVKGMKDQLLGQLQSAGFIGRNRDDVNSNSSNMVAIKAVLCAGLYPCIARRNPANSRLMTAREKSVRVHAASVVSDAFSDEKDRKKRAARLGPGAEPESPDGKLDWVMYEELVRVHSTVSVKSCSAISELTVMLIAGSTPGRQEESSSSSQPSAAVEQQHLQAGTSTALRSSGGSPSDRDLQASSDACAATTPASSGSQSTSACAVSSSDDTLDDDEVEAEPSDGLCPLHVDDWIQFRLPPSMVTCLSEMRYKLHRAFWNLLLKPRGNRSAEDKATIQSIVRALTLDSSSGSGGGDVAMLQERLSRMSTGGRGQQRRNEVDSRRPTDRGAPHHGQQVRVDQRSWREGHHDAPRVLGGGRIWDHQRHGQSIAATASSRDYQAVPRGPVRPQQQQQQQRQSTAASRRHGDTAGVAAQSPSRPGSTVHAQSHQGDSNSRHGKGTHQPVTPGLVQIPQASPSVAATTTGPTEAARHGGRSSQQQTQQGSPQSSGAVATDAAVGRGAQRARRNRQRRGPGNAATGGDGVQQQPPTSQRGQPSPSTGGGAGQAPEDGARGRGRGQAQQRRQPPRPKLAANFSNKPPPAPE